MKQLQFFLIIFIISGFECEFLKEKGKEEMLESKTNYHPIYLWPPECVEKCFFCHGQVCGDYNQHCCQVGKCTIDLFDGQKCKKQDRIDVKGCSESFAPLRCANPFVTTNDSNEPDEDDSKRTDLGSKKEKNSNTTNTTNTTNDNCSNDTNSKKPEIIPEITEIEKQKQKLPCIYEKYGSRKRNPTPDNETIILEEISGSSNDTETKIQSNTNLEQPNNPNNQNYNANANSSNQIKNFQPQQNSFFKRKTSKIFSK